MGSCELTVLLEMGPLRTTGEAWKGGLQSPHPLSRSVPPRGALLLLKSTVCQMSFDCTFKLVEISYPFDFLGKRVPVMNCTVEESRWSNTLYIWDPEIERAASCVIPMDFWYPDKVIMKVWGTNILWVWHKRRNLTLRGEKRKRKSGIKKKKKWHKKEKRKSGINKWHRKPTLSTFSALIMIGRGKKINKTKAS